MVALASTYDVTTDDDITYFNVYRSGARKCGICVVARIIKQQVLDQWNRAADEDHPFTVSEIKAVATNRCGECSLKGWPKVSVEHNTLFLHVASKQRRKIK